MALMAPTEARTLTSKCFFELARGNDFETSFGFFFTGFEGFDKKSRVDNGIVLEVLGEDIEVDRDGLKIDHLETVLTLDERSTADDRKLTTFEPKRNCTSGFLTFLATTNGVTANSGAIATTKAFFADFTDLGRFERFIVWL